MTGPVDLEPAVSRQRLPAETYRIVALTKGLDILTRFSDTRTSLRLKEICELTGLPMPTAFRLSTTLEEEGYLERAGDGAYRPGRAVLSLGLAALCATPVVVVARPELERMVESIGQTVNLGLRHRDRVLYAIRLHPNETLVTAHIRVGSTLPIAVSSLGKVLLAGIDKAERHEILGPEAFTAQPGPNVVQNGPNAVNSRADLDAQLRAIVASGYGLQDEEVAAGIRSIAAPVHDEGGRVVAAVNVAVPASQFSIEEVVEHFASILLESCARIETLLAERA